MFRKYWTLTLLVCTLSLFFYQNVCFAGMLGEEHANEWVAQKDELHNKKDDMDTVVGEYNFMHGQVKTLILNWSATEEAVKAAQERIVFRAGAAIISIGVAFVSGGSFAPGVWLAYNALDSTLDACTLDSSQFLLAMDAAIYALDRAQTNIDSAYNGGIMYLAVTNRDTDEVVETAQSTIGYVAQYNKYIKICSEHDGGISRMDSNGNIPSSAVSQNDLYNFVNMHNQTTNWYHAGGHATDGSHTILKRHELNRGDWSLQSDFEKDHRCEGPCQEMFRTPWEALDAHRDKCGTGKNIDILIQEYADTEFLSHLSGRAAEKGCGRFYYDCPSNPADDRHKMQICTKMIWEKPSGRLDAFPSYPCSRSFRHCTDWIQRDHNPTDSNPFEGAHSEKGDAFPPVSLSPSNGSYTATAGDSHTAQLPILSQGAFVTFYVITPNDATNGVSTYLTTTTRDVTESEVSVDFTFPADATGDYTFYAVIDYNDSTTHAPNPSYTVSVSPGESTPQPPAVTVTLSPENGLYTATDANKHTANVSVNEEYELLYWYLKSPSQTGLGSHLHTEPVSSTTADYEFKFALNVSGYYVITVKGRTLDSGVWFEDSYAVSVTIFIPSFSLSTSTYSPGSGLSVSVSANEPIYGCHLFVRSPGDTSTYGTKIEWFGNSRSTSQSISYTLPTTAASGLYKITVRAYPWYGNTYGAPKYLQKYVNVSSD